MALAQRSRWGNLGRLLRLPLAVSSLGLCASVGLTAAPQVSGDWAHYGGSAAGDRYSPLTGIDARNVANLQLAWRFETGEGGLQTTPLAINGVLYVVTPEQVVVALDGADGRELWRHTPVVRNRQPIRGLSYWHEGRERRLYASHGSHLTALDPDSGRPVPDFGAGGTIDLREGLGRDPATLPVYLTTPGVVHDDLLILGFRTAETSPAAPGAVRAYDVRTGALRWQFDLVPKAAQFGNDSWPRGAWATAGGANAWAGMAVDATRGIVFVPTGSAVPDFYGGDRHGDNLFANSLVALDARTGRRLWHFQAVHHDIWDRDFPSPPVLLQVRHHGRRIDAVAQPTKQGFLFLFDRVTGAPLFPIEERAVPSSDVPGERAALTQPVPSKPLPFARQRLTMDMLTDRTPEAAAAAQSSLASMENGGPFTPLRVGRQTVVFPGFDGGAEWGGAAVDPRRGILYINSNDIAWTGGLAKRGSAAAGETIYQQQCAGCHGADRQGSGDFPKLVGIGARLSKPEISAVIAQGKGRMPGFPQIPATAREALLDLLVGGAGGDKREATDASLTSAASYVFTGYRKFLDPDGYPAVKPPWGTLNAIDLNSGEYIWQVPLGEYPELVASGRRETGSENYGGPLVTATGLVFIGATVRDRKFRAFDARTGKLLWQTLLPYAGTASPASYVARGRQFIVIATSAQRDPKSAPGSAYVAYALPSTDR